MLKVTKTEITQDEFVKEVEALFPGKFTKGGLRVLFEYIEDYGDNYGNYDSKEGEYQLRNISNNFEEWTFEKYRDYVVERLGQSTDSKKDRNLSRDYLEKLLYEDVGEDGRNEWRELVVGFTDSTIIFTTYYTSQLACALREMYERMRTVPLEQFCEEFECSLDSDSIMSVFGRYKNGSFMDYDRSSRIFHLDFRGMTDTEITFEQYVMPRSMEEIIS